ncbi:rapamycin-insensitive companion of mTOR [Bacillus rossius redtenbacheri]|uniref:rapamycin-insensitive companion of mTOR n=1 Tax=Bacillus rossius redtenbacheri TaxID=93214 RepID=UPI002FDE8CAF
MASWMIRGRSLRSGRSVRSRHDSEDDVHLDMSKDASECAREILTNVCKKQGLTGGKRFGYLNAFVKLLTKTDIGAGDLGYTIEDIQCCLRVPMVHESSLVRAATLRTLRYLLKEERDVKTLIRLQYPHLIARSLDINLRNDMERVQALRLMRRMLTTSPGSFPAELVRCLGATVVGGLEEKDRMLRAALAILAETCVLNPEVFVACGGVSAVTHSVLDAQMPRIVECLCGALLFLLNHPRTRARAGVGLQQLAGPYCDPHPGGEKEAREQRFRCCHLALLSVLRSWPGLLHLCHPDNTSGLRAVVSVLYLRQFEVRKGILDLLYDLLCLPQPEWTDEYSVALDAVDPSRPRDSWRLSEGFVAAEGRDVLPNLAKFTPNIVEIHIAVLLYIFLETGLLEALVEVSVSSDTFISVRATVLLGELLQLMHRLLPPECCDVTPPLPGLLAHAANGRDLAAQQRALAAVSALSRLHQLHKRRPAPASLFLDLSLQGGSWARPAIAPGPGPSLGDTHKGRGKLYQFIVKEGSDDVLKDSGVLTHKDGFSWNWNVVRAVLKSRSEALKKLEDSNYRLFLKRLVHYFKPSSNRFSRVELGNKRQTQMYTLAGCELIDCLLDAEEVEGGKLLAELLGDISVQIDAILTSKSAHDCFFSPQQVTSSVCQDYFLFIGRLCRTSRGNRALDKAGIFQQLMSLVVSTNHDCYMKLVISGLDYSMDGMPRVILSKLLTVPSESSRLYATRYLLVLLRAKLPDFHKWGVELLASQLYDKSKAVSLAALAVLGEATHDKMYLDAIIALRPSLLHLGDRGLLLLIRFLSTPAGFTFLQDANFVSNELEHWATSFNYRYVRLVEGEIHDSFTLHQRGEDGRYSRRVTSAKHAVRDVFVPPHLYGQLVQHDKGFQLLLREGRLDSLFQVVSGQRCGSEQEILELKAALWGCGHAGSAPAGVALLAEEGVVAAVVRLAETCPVYSVRGTALYVLGLLATTRQGADELQHAGWLCVRHNRHDRWPVIEDKPCAEDAEGKEESSFGTEADNLSLSSGTESDCKVTGQASHEGQHFYIPDGEAESIGSADDEGLLLDETSESTHWGDFPGRKSSLSHQRKSQTLPHARQGRGLSAPRHIRSLSESKQPHVAPSPSPGQLSVDWQSAPRSKENAVYSPGGLVVSWPEETKSRSNSCTDSSGVSSCDSAVGRHPTVERVQTLSPIPSSTSLNTLRSPAPDVMDKLRKLSLQSCSPSEGLAGTPDAPSSRLSQQDLLGYATLRSLHQHRRPLFSDTSSLAAVELLGFDDHGLAAVNAARANKIRSLDRQLANPVMCEFEATNPPSLFGGASSAGLSAKTYIGSRTTIFSRLSVLGGSGQNHYMGIALPRRLASLFPCETAGPAPPPDERKKSDKGTSFGEMEQVQEVVEDTGETTSSDTEDTDETRKGRVSVSRGRYKHSAVHCLSCCRLRDRKISTGSYHRYRTDTESSYGGTDSPIVTLKRRKSHSTCNGLLGAVTAGSMDSANSLDAGSLVLEEEGSLLSKSLARKQILRHISRMSNPVWCKQSKQALLQLKQQNPSAFQDVCLYSEVCHRMGSSTYRLVARKFIQELFLDLTFDSLYDEPASILQLQKPAEMPTVTAGSSSSPSVHSSCLVTFLPTLCVTSSPPQLPASRVPPGDSQALAVVREETTGPGGSPGVWRTQQTGGRREGEIAAVESSGEPASVGPALSTETGHPGCTDINSSILVINSKQETGYLMTHPSKPNIISCQPEIGIENLGSITYADESESESDCTVSTTNSTLFFNKIRVSNTNDTKMENYVQAGGCESRTRLERLVVTVSENNVPSRVASHRNPDACKPDSSKCRTSITHSPAKPLTAKAVGACAARQRKLATASPPNISTLTRTLSQPVPVPKTEENGKQKSGDSLPPPSSARVSECKKL